jgi:S-formylglutathione hydrolase FrmB
MKGAFFKRILAKIGLAHLSDRLELYSVSSDLLGRRLDYSILRPPPSTDGNDGQLPVVYLLHGLGNDCRALDDFGVSDRLYSAMSTGRMPRANVVTPSGERGFYIDWYDGSRPYESHIIEEVLPAAERLLAADGIPRELRHIAGVSMGGIGALLVGLRHPDLFASVASISGPVMDERQAVAHLSQSFMRWFVDLKRIFSDGSDPEFLATHNAWSLVQRRLPHLNQRLFVSAGRDEKPFFRETTKAFHGFLADNGVAHGYEIFPGGHGWRYWAPVIERAISHGIGVEPAKSAQRKTA